MTTTPRSRATGVQIDVIERLPSHPDASSLLEAFYQEQLKRNGFADPIAMSPPDYAVPNGGFVVAYLGSLPVGCGAYRCFVRLAHAIEIKKVYVDPAARGLGTGRAVMTWLERHAATAGARQVLLATGGLNTPAKPRFV